MWRRAITPTHICMIKKTLSGNFNDNKKHKSIFFVRKEGCRDYKLCILKKLSEVLLRKICYKSIFKFFKDQV